MSRVQPALNVDDLDEAITFYSKLFNTEPGKVKPGYANFAITVFPLKLVLLENSGHGGTLNHLGVEVAASDIVHAEIARLTDEGLLTEEEINTTCCFAAGRFIQSWPTPTPSDPTPTNPTRPALTWLTFDVAGLRRPVYLLFCVGVRWNLDTKAGP